MAEPFLGGGQALQGQKDAGKLPAGGNAVQLAKALAGVGRDEKLGRFQAPGPELAGAGLQGSLGRGDELHPQAAGRHAQPGQFGLNRPGQFRRGLFSFFRKAVGLGQGPGQGLFPFCLQLL